MLIVGWDVSTTVIALCAIDSDDGVPMRYASEHLTGESLMSRYRDAIDWIDTQVQSLMRERPTTLSHFVEDRLGNFSAGMTTLQTLMKLAAMNAVVSNHLSSSGVVTHVHPATAKRISGLKVPKGGDKKQEAIKLASTSGQLLLRLTKKGKLAIGVEDEADAYLLALTGLRLHRGEATIDQAEKTGRAKARSGRRAPDEGRRARVHVPGKTGPG